MDIHKYKHNVRVSVSGPDVTWQNNGHESISSHSESNLASRLLSLQFITDFHEDMNALRLASCIHRFYCEFWV